LNSPGDSILSDGDNIRHSPEFSILRRKKEMDLYTFEEKKALDDD
jgi:hypothetical protein